MTASQGHGFVVEDIILSEMKRQADLSGRLPVDRGYTARFDAPGYQDPYGKGLPTSIKTCKKKGDTALICLGDASRITQMTSVPQMRLLVALYDQVGGEKVFREMREYLLKADEWNKLVGGAPQEVLQDFAKAIRHSDPVKARAIAREWKETLAEEYPAVLRWNPKIDSKGQRRIQCSVTTAEIESVIKDKRRIRVFGQLSAEEIAQRPEHLKPASPRLWAGQVKLPIRVASAARHRHPKAAPDGQASGPGHDSSAGPGASAPSKSRVPRR